MSAWARETVYVWWRARLRSATLRSDHAEQDCSARLRRGLWPLRSAFPRGCASRGPRPPAHAAARRQSQLTVPARQRVDSRPASLGSWRPCSCRARSRKRSSRRTRGSQAARSARRSASDPGTTAASLGRARAAPEEVVLLHSSTDQRSAAPWHQVCSGTPAARTPGRRTACAADSARGDLRFERRPA